MTDLVSAFEQVPSYHPENLIEDIFEGLSGEDLPENSPNDDLVAVPTLEERQQEEESGLSLNDDEQGAESGQSQSANAEKIDLVNNVDAVAVSNADPLSDPGQNMPVGVELTQQAGFESDGSIFRQSIEQSLPVSADSLDGLPNLSVYPHYVDATDPPENQYVTINSENGDTFGDPLVVGSDQILNGNGVIKGDVVLIGTFSPGNSPGTIIVDEGLTINGTEDSDLITLTGNVTGEGVLTVLGLDGDDTLVVDFSEGNPIPDGGLTFDGGDGFDTITIRGGKFGKISYLAFSPSSGTINLDGLLIRYFNIEPIEEFSEANEITFSGTSGDDTINIVDGGEVSGVQTIEIQSPQFENIKFANKTHVTIDGGGGQTSSTSMCPPGPRACSR